jgi:sugar phosphate isomerase/epimerase
MRLAFSTLACPNWSMEQVIAAARQYGYEGLELRLIDGEVITPALDQATRDQVKRQCREAGLPIICLDTSVRVAQPDAGARQAQINDGMAMLELAAAWESPLIRVFGGAPQGSSDADAFAGAADCLSQLAARGKELGVAVALETHDVFSAGAKVAQVLAQVPNTNAGALWDTLHPYRMGETAEQTLGLIGDRLLHVHVKDGRRPADGGPNWDLTLLGEGDVPMQDILARLRAAGYDGWLAVEWEKKWHPEIAEPEVALPQHADLLRAYLARL